MADATLDKAFEAIAGLVRDFDANKHHYMSPAYSEIDARRDFIDKFFMALGWDVRHDRERNPFEQEVKVERNVDAKGSQRRADYSFSLAPNFRGVKFYVEAKKPFVNVATPDNYFQILRYGWNTGTPFGVITDFEQFHVIDCRYKPNIDTALECAFRQYGYKDYLDREKFAEIYWLFSREAVADGSLEKRAAELPRKRGAAKQRGLSAGAYQPIDESFLKDIDDYRDRFARSLKNRNPELEGLELTEATQRIIDRLVFMRFLEDKIIESDIRIGDFGNKGSAWGDFKAASRKLDSIYNGIIFKKHGLIDSESLNVDEKEIADIFKEISSLNSPYNFELIPIHILGSIYERFLGRVIRTTDKRAKVEDKPEVKKAGGVYYTPQYIVGYIVKNTVDRLVQGKLPDEIARLRILDPACGSGSFLIGAYDYLLEYHRKWYNANKRKIKKGDCVEHEDGTFHLALARKREILLNNIYGVDIDTQAVEVAQMSLFLKLLEEETTSSARNYQQEFRQTLLPDLKNNIKCGNSLIDMDFYSDPLLPHFEKGGSGGFSDRVNAFDWSAEFPEIMKSGGFDCVIGNPPYVRQEGLGEFKDYFSSRFKVYHGTADLYAYFVERGVTLLKEGGLFGYIVANKWMRANYGEPLRRWLKERRIVEITDFGDLPVFKKATTYPCILIIRKDSSAANIPATPPKPPLDKGRMGGVGIPKGAFSAAKVKTLKFENGLQEYVDANRYKVDVAALDDKGWSLADDAVRGVLDKINSKGVPLGEYVEGKIYYGIKTGLNEAFVIDGETRARLIKEDRKSEEVIKPFLAGRDIKRYQAPKADKWLILFPKGWTQVMMSRPARNSRLPLRHSRESGNPETTGFRVKPGMTEKGVWEWLSENYPAIASHLKPHAGKGNKRCDKGDYWWELRACDYYEEFEKAKIMYAEIATKGQFTLEMNNSYSDTTSYIIPVNDKYLLGILNSSLWTFLFSSASSEIRGGFFRWKRQYMSPLPIRPIDFNDKADKARHDRMVSLVDTMLTLQKQLTSSRTDHEKTSLKRQIDATDNMIDRLVYELYGLTDEEVAVVEGGVVDLDKGINNEDDSKAPRHDRALEKGPDPGGAEAPVSGEHPGTGKRIHGVRGRAGEPSDAQGLHEDTEERTPNTRRTRHIEPSLGIKSYTELAPDLAKGVERVMASIIEKPIEHLRITPDFICGLHKQAFGELFPSWAGRYRDRDVTVGSYAPPPYFEVPVLMRQYCDDLEARLSALGERPEITEALLEALAFAEGRFLSIHPFLDFNGRVARMLLFALLVRLDLPPVSLLPNEKDKAGYLNALAEADIMNWTPLVEIWRLRLSKKI